VARLTFENVKKVQSSHAERFREIFVTCRRILGKSIWENILASLDAEALPEFFPVELKTLRSSHGLPDYIDDVARIEYARYHIQAQSTPSGNMIDTLSVNPMLKLVPVAWRNLVALIQAGADRAPQPQPAADSHVIIWRHPQTHLLQMREALDLDLLALKVVVEDVTFKQATAQGNGALATIKAAIERAKAEGLLVSPPSRIHRDVASIAPIKPAYEPFVTTETFVLQWHITQACDLHCRHCYDRSNRAFMPYDTAVAVLDDFGNFCNHMRVTGQVTFTGGNPLLYPHFTKLYRAARDRGFKLAILGNPAPISQVEDLVAIARPEFFQVSLEGLEAHNDAVRGPGHFARTLIFLKQMRELDVYTMVMLTLYRDNLDQVLPLAELLRDRTDFFTFNRLSAMGEGSQLSMVPPKRFRELLKDFEAAARHNPTMMLKDNLINLIRTNRGSEAFGGCTGYGCGAAFNFVALLSDGEVHACRKFPSLIGNINADRLVDIYQSERARQYRTGSEACRDCSLNVVCRGCPAVTYSCGLDVFKDKDPYCFKQTKQAGNKRQPVL